MPLAFSIYYTEEEKRLLEEICKKKGTPFSAIENLVEEETNVSGMGRRHRLFQSIRRIVEEATDLRYKEAKK